MTSSDLKDLIDYAHNNNYMHQPFIQVYDQYEKDLQELFDESIADDALSFLKDEGMLDT